MSLGRVINKCSDISEDYSSSIFRVTGSDSFMGMLKWLGRKEYVGSMGKLEKMRPITSTGAEEELG